MPRPISGRRRLSDERRNNGRPAPYRRGGRQRRQVSRFVIDESVNDDDDTGKYHFKDSRVGSPAGHGPETIKCFEKSILFYK